MDLGIKGRSAIVCAGSRGLGRGCAVSLARNGVDLVINGRDRASLEQTAQAIREETGVAVQTVAGDISEPSIQAALVEAVPEPTSWSTTTAARPAATSARSTATPSSRAW